MNYCGKDCEICTVRDTEQCPGCRRITEEGRCEIASCCCEKGHEYCQTCTQRTWCPTVRQAGSMPKYRKEKEEAECARLMRTQENAKIMVKWCRPLFLILLISEILGLIDSLFESIPTVSLILSGFSILFCLAKALCLFRMRPAASRYEKAALFTLLNAVFACVSAALLWSTLGSMLITLIGIPGAVISYIAVYQTYTAHSDAVTDADGELAEKWEKLWKWTIYALAGIFLSVPVSAILGILGVLLMLASMIAMIVCVVWELIYLHRMIESFRWYLD